MYNLILSLAAGLVVALAIRFGTSVGWVGSVIPGLLALAITYVALNLRAQKRLQAMVEAAVAEAQARRFDRAIQLARQARTMAPWLFGADAAVAALIGQFHWWKGEQEAAVPHLERAAAAQWPARVMLAIARWKKRDLAGMKTVFEDSLKARGNKKQGLLWCAYAWFLEKEGQHDAAVAVLGRGVTANPTDEKLKSALQSVQNGKRLKIGKLYMEWYNFGVEAPPQMMPPGFRPGKRATYRQ
jgi:tetratricopeptide (TPR) repeat protein